jgi:hypothetical protein
MWAVGDTIRQGEVHGTVTAVNGTFSVYYHLENGTCGECLPHRLEKGFRMSRPRKDAATKKAEAAAKEANTLLDAVKFCAPGFAEAGETYATHARIEGGYITTYNGIVQFGHKIETELKALPHYGLLLKSLRATDSTGVQITQLDAKRLQIKGKGFRTIVPCLDNPDLVSRQPPDPPVSGLDSRMREAFEALKQIVNKRGDTVMQSALFIGNGFAVGCDNVMLGMYWHGLSFPEVAVPADFVDAVLKVPKSLVSVGYAPNQSLTFYFDDASYIRTQLYAEQYPDYTKALPEHWEGIGQLPDTFYDALERIEPFINTKDKPQRHVYPWENAFGTDDTLDTGTVVDCPGLQDSDSGLDVERLLKLKGLATHMDYTHRTKVRFLGENFRGVLMTFVSERVREPTPEPEPMTVPPYTEHVFSPPQPAGPIEYDDSEGDEYDADDDVEVTPPTAGGFAVPQV